MNIKQELKGIRMYAIGIISLKARELGAFKVGQHTITFDERTNKIIVNAERFHKHPVDDSKYSTDSLVSMASKINEGKYKL